MLGFKNKAQLRISATQLDRWRKFRSFEWYTEEQLIQDLFGDFMPTNEMQIGSAAHALIDDMVSGKDIEVRLYESPEDEYVGTICEKDGWKFDYTSFLEVFDHIPASRSSIRECKHVSSIQIADFDFELVAVPDLIWGNTAYDFKSVWKELDGFSIEDYYINSMQWRVYLSVFALSRFRYVFLNLQKTTHEDIIMVRDIDAVSCYAYPNMLDEILAAMQDFGQWIIHRNYTQHFQHKGILV